MNVNMVFNYVLEFSFSGFMIVESDFQLVFVADDLLSDLVSSQQLSKWTNLTSFDCRVLFLIYLKLMMPR